MYSNRVFSPKQAAKELTNLNTEFVSIIIQHLAEQYAAEPLIGETTDETLVRTYRNDGKKMVVNDLKDLFFPKGL